MNRNPKTITLINILMILFFTGCSTMDTSGQHLLVDSVEKVARVTGPTLEGEEFPNPNQTHENYGVRATDLGIIWDATTDDEDSKVMVAFGDTYDNGWFGFGGGGLESGWRSNVLAISRDTDLSDGLAFESMISEEDNPEYAKEIIASAKETHGHGDFTSIPTAGITVDNQHFIHYMQIKQWGEPGEWDTNFSEIAYSDDDGQKWINSGVTWDAESNFAQVAFLKEENYVYMYGTPSGRFGELYLARVPETNVLEKTSYEYWNGDDWITDDESVATPIVEAPVSEVSVVYHSHFEKYIMMYLNENRYSLVIRTADNLEGEWSPEEVVVTGEEIPMLYGGYIHPWADDSQEIYFVLSEWGPYNVILMKADLKLSEIEE